MSRKQKDLIQQLQYDLDRADSDYQDLANDYNRKCNELYHCTRTTTEMKATKRNYAGDIAFDYWPIKDWLRFGVTSKWSNGRYFQFVAGPWRVEFFES